MTATKIDTLVLGATTTGLSVMVDVVRESAKAIMIRNRDTGATAWLPRSALSRNDSYSYGDTVAMNVAQWFARKVLGSSDARARVALGLSCY